MRGPQVMRGYRNRPEATAATLAPGGWLRTGDLCYVDADGYLFVVDRLKELIKYKGAQVAPAELEALLCAHPAVADAAVVPRPDPEAGEVPVAHVATRSEVSAARGERGRAPGLGGRPGCPLQAPARRPLRRPGPPLPDRQAAPAGAGQGRAGRRRAG